MPDAYSFELQHTHAATVYGLHASAATVRRSASSQLLHAFIPWSAENVCHGAYPPPARKLARRIAHTTGTA